jgi:hypothetical protein
MTPLSIPEHLRQLVPALPRPQAAELQAWGYAARAVLTQAQGGTAGWGLPPKAPEVMLWKVMAPCPRGPGLGTVMSRSCLKLPLRGMNGVSFSPAQPSSG